jgi:hypothetical protein
MTRAPRHGEIVDLGFQPTELDGRLVELTVEQLKLARGRRLVVETIEEVELGCRIRCDLLDLVLTEHIGAEDLVAIERHGHRRSSLV